MVSGRTSEARPVTVTTTSASSAVTGAAGTFNKADVGRVIAATGIPAGTTLASVTSGTAAVLSANATATGSRSAVVGSPASSVSSDSQTAGYFGWSPETETEAEAYSVSANNAGVVPPDRITNTTTPVTDKSRRTRS